MRHLCFILILAQLPTFPKGCSEFAPDEPMHVRIVHGSGSTVELAWDRVEGADQYRVLWHSVSSAGLELVGSIATSELELSIDSLPTGTEYLFEVSSLSKGVRSSPASVSWMSAAVYTKDAVTGGEIRLYNLAVSVGKGGSGLVLDPELGGPYVSSVAQSNPMVGKLHLVGMPTYMQFDIGAPSGFSLLTAHPLFRRDVVVSDSFFVVSSLQEWELPLPLSSYFSETRTEPFEHVPDQLPWNSGFGFLLRVGNPDVQGTVHYARVFVKPDAAGKLVRFDGNDLYIVIEVAWQSKPDYPYL